MSDPAATHRARVRFAVTTRASPTADDAAAIAQASAPRASGWACIAASAAWKASLSGNHRDKLALGVGDDSSRSSPGISQRPLDRLAHRQCGFHRVAISTDAASATSLSTVATPPRVASRIKRMPGAASSIPPMRPLSGAQSAMAIGASSRKVTARREDRRAVVAEHPAVDQHHIARLDPPGARVPPCDAPANPDPGRGQEELVAGAVRHDLGVAGYDADPGFARRLRHRRGDPTQQIDRAAFLDDRGAGEVERHGARDGEVVDRAAYGEPADIATGEEQRVDDKPVAW